jgi:aspartyl aminopeptidase
MHSSYETAAVKDLEYLEKAMTAYYSTTLIATDDGGCIIR